MPLGFKQMAKDHGSHFRSFTLLGFRVEIRPGFIIFLGLVVFIYGGSLGLWAAGTLAAFTLIHELGHALAARATGAHAEISLDFLAGYASYLPSRPLARWERAGIAAAGSFAQGSVATVIMLLLGANPLSRSDILRNEATLSIWWAGIVLAVVNLIPVIPLDGGAIVSAALEKFAPHRGANFMMWFSIVLTSGGLVAAVAFEQARSFLPLAAILLVMQLQLFGSRQRAATPLAGLSQTDYIILVMSGLQRVGNHHEAAKIGAEAFRQQPNALVAAKISQSLTALGDHDGAQAWMRAAEQASLIQK
jgi:Zn-dependent protease